MPTPRTQRSICAVLFLIATTAIGCKVYRPTPTSDEFKNTFEVMNIVQLVEQLSDGLAPAEFECQKEKMTFKKMGNWTRIRVTGCNKRATYVFVNSVGWVLNTDIQYYDESMDDAPPETAPAEADSEPADELDLD